MNISLFGLGYVGAVTAGCLGQRGHAVIGCDIQANKVDAINNGKSPVHEPGLDALIAEAHRKGLIAATHDAEDAVAKSSISLVCVGTPSRPDGSVNAEYLEAVIRQIACAVRRLKRPHTVVIRSTILPDVLESQVLRLPEVAEASPWLRLCTNPEFLREGTAIADFDEPPMIVIGERQPGDGDELARIYEGIAAPVYRLGIREASLVKYASNIFHALKIVFGNEIGALCQAAGIDSHEVMNVFCADKQLNISPRYLRPGFAYGGSCLPKDLRATMQFGRMRNVATPMLSGIELSNKNHIERCIDAILATGSRRVAILGLSFKNDTDDLRESPTVEIVERLIGKGLQVTVYDDDVLTSRLFGSNLTFIQQHLPHIASLMHGTLQEAVESNPLVVLAKPLPKYIEAIASLRSDQTLVDLVRAVRPSDPHEYRYTGLVG